MKTICKVLGILLILFGSQAVLLGALYKIQSWEMPTIGGSKIELLLVGLLVASSGTFLLLAASLMKKKAPLERLDLDENRIPESKIKEPLRDDDLLV